MRKFLTVVAAAVLAGGYFYVPSALESLQQIQDGQSITTTWSHLTDTGECRAITAKLPRSVGVAEREQYITENADALISDVHEQSGCWNEG